MHRLFGNEYSQNKADKLWKDFNSLIFSYFHKMNEGNQEFMTVTSVFEQCYAELFPKHDGLCYASKLNINIDKNYMEYFIILIAALFHAIWNSIIKDSSDKLMILTSIRSVGLLFGIIVIVFLPPLKFDAIPFLVVTALIVFMYFWFLLNAYRVGDSQVFPISRGTTGNENSAVASNSGFTRNK